MKEALYIVPSILFVLWLVLVFTDFMKMKEVRKIDGLKDCGNYYAVKREAKLNPGTNLETIFLDLKKYRNRKLALWFFSLIASVIALITIGVLTAN